MFRRLFSSLEPLESRIAPAALTVLHPLADIIAGVGDKSAKIDLGNLFDSSAQASYRTHIEFATNFDVDPGPGFTAGKVVLELFDEKTPFSVQNFVNYVNALSDRGDYDGTFFHRSVNQPGTNTTGNLQILQAGGYEALVPASHIPVGVPVHNEYVSTDAELQNTLGTISMAKTGAGPNTGTSEFFFNMGDNSQTLGAANNGGYTVFGKVTEGLAVLQAIFAQPTANVSVATKNGALTDVPYQGTYNPNPDQNLVTPSPAPKAGQLIQITSAHAVTPAYNAVSDGVTFTISSYVDLATNKTPTFFTPTLVGDALTLKYNGGQAGVADVSIIASKPGFDAVTETFRVSVLPNLALYSAGDTLQPYIGPGDTGTAKITLVNNGAATFTGTYDINFYLSKATSQDPTGQLFDESDLVNKVGSVTKNLSILSGQSLNVSASLTLPNLLADSSSPAYRVLAVATPIAGSSGNEAFADDNVMVDGKVHEMHNLFGTASDGTQLARHKPSITYLDADNHLVTATLKGPGVGLVTQLDAAGHVDLDFYGTTDKTSVSIVTVDPTATSAGVAKTTVRRVAFRDDFNGIGAAGAVQMGGVNLTDSFFAVGGVKTLTLGDITGPNPSVSTNDHLLVIGSSPVMATVHPMVKVGNLENTTIESTLVLDSLTVGTWTNTSAEEVSHLTGVKTFTVAGNMDANVTVSAVYGDPRYITTTAAATTGVTSFKVAGVLSDSSVQIAGNVGTVDLGGLQSSEFLVGAETVPTNVSGFNSIRTVSSFIVRGVANEPFAITDSDVAAAKFTSIKVLNKAAQPIETTSGNDAFGFVADSIAAYNRGGANPVAAMNLSTGLTDQNGNYVVRLV